MTMTRLACVLALSAVASVASAQTTSTDTTTVTDTTTSPSSTSTSPSTSTSTSTSPSTSTSTSPSTSTSTSTSSSPSTSTSSSASGSTHASASSHPSTATTGATGAPAGTGTAQPPPPEPEPEGDGRDVDFLWIEAFGGVANVNLVAFRNSNFADAAASGGASVFDEVNATGPMVGGALGFRIYWIAVGARTTFASYNTFQIGTVGGEVALRFPIPVVEPYIRAGFGYAWQGDANYTVSTGGVTAHPATTVYGWAFNAAAGIDIFLVNWFTIGAGIGFDVLNMTRQSDPRMACMGVTDFCPMNPGDAVGYQLSGFGQIGFHI